METLFKTNMAHRYNLDTAVIITSISGASTHNFHWFDTVTSKSRVVITIFLFFLCYHSVSLKILVNCLEMKEDSVFNTPIPYSNVD